MAQKSSHDLKGDVVVAPFSRNPLQKNLGNSLVPLGGVLAILPSIRFNVRTVENSLQGKDLEI